MTPIKFNNTRILNMNDETKVATVITLYDHNLLKTSQTDRKMAIQEILQSLGMKDLDINYYLEYFGL